MSEIRETSWEHYGSEPFATFFSSEQKFLRRFRRDAELYPDQVIVKCVNEDGSMIVQYPYSWCKPPRPPRKVNLTDEQRSAASERMKALAASRKCNT